MSEKFPTGAQEAQQEMPTILVEKGEGNVVRMQEEGGGGAAFLKKNHAETDVSGKFVPEELAREAVESNEALSYEEKYRIIKNMGRVGLSLVLGETQQTPNAALRRPIDIHEDGKRIGGGGNFISPQAEEVLPAGKYVEMPELPEEEEKVAAGTHEAANEAQTSVRSSNVEAHRPKASTIEQSSNRAAQRRAENIARRIEQDQGERRRGAWYKKAGAAAIALMGVAGLFSGGAEAEGANAPVQGEDISTSTEYFNDVPEIAPIINDAAETDFDTNAWEALEMPNVAGPAEKDYAYPWNWAEDMAGQGAGSELIYDLTAKASEAGHDVQLHETGKGLWVSIDGKDDTASVINVLDQYR